ncbi:MAG: hypothetical protein IPG76_20325 [Acidobacteria bacterium]|nr:hypothetical protein [Acidobacteriota bacterium]
MKPWTALNDALKGVTGRKAIVLFTDGVDTSSRRSSAEGTLIQVEEADVLVFRSVTTPRWIILMAGQSAIPEVYHRSSILFHAFPAGAIHAGRGLSSIINFPDSGRRADFPFRVPVERASIARRSVTFRISQVAAAGKLYYAENVYGLSRAFTQIAEELRHQYALSYYPTNGNRDGSYRKIRVRVTQPGAVVRAREGYRAVADTQAGNSDSKDDRKRPVLKRRQLAEK